jgi:integrase
MTPKPTTKNGKPCWMLDARGQGFGRISAPTIEKVFERLAEKKGEKDRALLPAPKPQPAAIKLADARALWVADMESRGLNAEYIDHCEWVLDAFSTYAGAETECGEVTTEHVKTWLAARSWSADSKNTAIRRLSAFFSWCERDKKCVVEHPVRGIRKYKTVKGTPRVFTVDECRRLLTTAQTKVPCMLHYLVLGLFCGIRPEGEMGKMLPEYVHIGERVIDLPDHVSKTRDRRIVEISENAVKWLQLVPVEIVINRYWRKRLCNLAEVQWSPDVTRHSFASYHIKQHKNPGLTAEQMGHEQSLKTLYRNYVATVTREEAEAFWKLEPYV